MVGLARHLDLEAEVQRPVVRTRFVHDRERRQLARGSVVRCQRRLVWDRLQPLEKLVVSLSFTHDCSPSSSHSSSSPASSFLPRDRFMASDAGGSRPQSHRWKNNGISRVHCHRRQRQGFCVCPMATSLRGSPPLSYEIIDAGRSLGRNQNSPAPPVSAHETTRHSQSSPLIRHTPRKDAFLQRPFG